MSRIHPRRLLVLLSSLLIVSVAAPAVAKEKTDHAGHERRKAIDLVVEGVGFGHGRGLSQYGALTRAQDGDTWQEILGFYYPGTNLSGAAGKIRVLITDDTSNDVKVHARSGLRVKSLGNGRTWRLPGKVKGRKVNKWRIKPAGERSEISSRTNKWRTWKDPKGQAEFSAGGAPITLVLPKGRASYRGVLRSVVPDSGRGRDTLNVVPLKPYVRGVVPSEVPALWPDAAVAAQSVAARTYAVFEREANDARYYDLCDTAHCQVYAGVGGEHPAADENIERTRGRILTFAGAPAFAQFSASNGGWTVDGGQPYLVAQADPDDEYPSWSHTVDAAALEDLRPAIGDFESVEVTARDGNGRFGGRVETMEVTGSLGTATISGDQFRVFYGLKSTLFRLPE